MQFDRRLALLVLLVAGAALVLAGRFLPGSSSPAPEVAPVVSLERGRAVGLGSACARPGRRPRGRPGAPSRRLPAARRQPRARRRAPGRRPSPAGRSRLRQPGSAARRRRAGARAAAPAARRRRRRAGDDAHRRRSCISTARRRTTSTRSTASARRWPSASSPTASRTAGFARSTSSTRSAASARCASRSCGRSLPCDAGAGGRRARRRGRPVARSGARRAGAGRLRRGGPRASWCSRCWCCCSARAACAALSRAHRRRLRAGGRSVVGARPRRARRRSAGGARRARRGRPARDHRPAATRAATAAPPIAQLAGHPVELRARGALQQGAIVAVSGSLAPVPPSTGDFDRRTWLAHQGVHETLAARSDLRARRARQVSRAPSIACAGARAQRSRPVATTSRCRSRPAWPWAARHNWTTTRSTTSAPRGWPTCWPSREATSSCSSRRCSASPGWRACRGRWRTPARSRPVLAYAAIVGGGPSVVRAAATGVLVSLAWLVGSARDPWHLLALAAAAVLALDPWAAEGPGFQLSFAAVAAIHGLAPRIRVWLDGTPVPLRLCNPLAISLACTLATAPVALVHFGRTSLVAEPAREPARTACGRAAPLARARGLRAVARCARRDASPWTCRYARWAPTSGSSRERARGSTGRCRGGHSRIGALAGGGGWLVRRRPAAALAGALAGLLLGLAWPSARAPPPPPRALRVTFLDVGQGDAALIEAPGLRALVDTGPPDAACRAAAPPARRDLARCAAPVARRERPRRPRRRDPAQPARRVSWSHPPVRARARA